ncbi:hypothetical protein PMKS-001314 [Pichia membranifaciens]|uniref:ADP-ribosylation factor GTPase-activating protein n=1 Tax=Pichia membranifaciens TaxID=4926 RepID=A0A1Q2YE42_9ASCO|nr:hypothetical protein PMKS-001314 [Pichia membranifaciens]
MSNIELIRLNSHKEDGLDFVLKIPFIYDRLLLKFVKSLNLESMKCSLTARKTSSTFHVNSHDIKLPLNNNYTDLLSLTIYYEDKLVYELNFYREPLSVVTILPRTSPKDAKPTSSLSQSKDNQTKSAQNKTLNKETASDNPFPIPMADGPLLRETLNSYEQLAPHVLKQLQHTMENINAMDQNLKGLESSRFQLIDTLKEFRNEFLPTLPNTDLVYSNFESFHSSSFSEDFNYLFLRALHQSTSETKIDFSALRTLQNFSSSKKNFEEESKKYYDWLSKLMSSGKSKDEKLLTKMKNFTVAQMNYFNFLYDTVTPMLLSLLQPTSLFNKNYWRLRPLRDQAVKKVQSCSTFDEFSGLIRCYSKVTNSKNSLLLSDKNSCYKADTFDTPLKAGLLFVFGGQGKSGWHKQWLVLCNGKLFEYMDWRKGADLRNSPIDISLCNIKLLDANDHNTIDIGSRKNCFRVINAKGVEHVFQAFTAEDANEWVKALFEAGQMIAYAKQNSEEGKKESTDKKSSISKHTLNSSENWSKSKAQSDFSTDNSLNRKEPLRVRTVSSVSLSLLHVVQHNDSSNIYCADCGSTEQVEWISLNLLVVFCIQCSSSHRALGTSVSKVRSLMLDSFVGESRALVHHINNAKMNSIYEANLQPNQKPLPSSRNEERLEFITNKYMKKAFINNNIRNNALQLLLEGVRDDDMVKVLEGIVGGADINKKIFYSATASGSSTIFVTDSKEQNYAKVSFLEYALLHPSILDGREVFDVAELLALNGCDAGTQIRNDSRVNENARKWWQDRIDRMNGGIVAPSPPPQQPPQLGNKSSNAIPLSSNGRTGTGHLVPVKQSSFNSNNRVSLSGSRPSLSITGSYKKPSASSKSKIKSPKEGFNLFKKKIKSLE